MKISEIANTLKGNIENFAQSRGGVVTIASNVRDMWETAFKSSEKPRIIIAYAGEQIRGEFSVAALIHRVDRDWFVAVTRGRTFTVPRGKGLTESVQNAEAFYDVVEAVRDLIRTSVSITEELQPDFKAIRPMDLGNGLVVDGYVIEFSTANDLPNVQAQPDSLAMPPLETPQP